MLVQARVSFVDVAGEQKRRHVAGDMFELPEGVDWLAAGLVFEVPEEGVPIETAMVEPPERAVTRRRRPKARTAK